MTASELYFRVVLPQRDTVSTSRVTPTGLADGIRRSLCFSSPPGLFL